MTFRGSGPGGGAATCSDVVDLVQAVVPDVRGVDVTEGECPNEIEVKLYGADARHAAAVREALNVHLCGHLRALVIYDPAFEDTPHPMMLTGPVTATCDDCKGSGQYVGLTEMRSCPTCGGLGTCLEI